AYLAARWFAQEGLSVVELERMIADSTIWTQAPDARRTLWEFAAALLDSEHLIALWARIVDKEEWDVLRRALKAEAERRGLPAAQNVRGPHLSCAAYDKTQTAAAGRAAPCWTAGPNTLPFAAPGPLCPPKTTGGGGDFFSPGIPFLLPPKLFPPPTPLPPPQSP